MSSDNIEQINAALIAIFEKRDKIKKDAKEALLALKASPEHQEQVKAKKEAAKQKIKERAAAKRAAKAQQIKT